MCGTVLGAYLFLTLISKRISKNFNFCSFHFTAMCRNYRTKENYKILKNLPPTDKIIKLQANYQFNNRSGIFFLIPLK